MKSDHIPDLLHELNGPGASDAWIEFLERYSPVMQQVIALSVSGVDAQADCFVFACEALAKSRFRRLRKFDPGGSASFVTWLRAVVRNLCLDWRRKSSGRFQPFGWTKEIAALDQQVFRCVHQQGCTVEQTLAYLAPMVPSLTASAVEESAERVGAKLSPHERWLLSSRQVRVESLDAVGQEGEQSLDIPDLAPNPESVAIDSECRELLARAIGELPPGEQIILRMRFEQDLTLQEIARIAGLKDAAAADRRIRALLGRVRNRMTGSFARLPEKVQAASV